MPAPSTTSNRYAWIGSSGGLWNLAANWQDLTSGTTPAGFFPGSMTPVTIAGPDGQAYEAIGGGGSDSTCHPAAPLCATRTFWMSSARHATSGCPCQMPIASAAHTVVDGPIDHLGSHIRTLAPQFSQSIEDHNRVID